MQRTGEETKQWMRDLVSRAAARADHPKHGRAYATYLDMQDHEERGDVDAQIRKALALDRWKEVVSRENWPPRRAQERELER